MLLRMYIHWAQKYDYSVELQKVCVAGLTEAQRELVLYANAKRLLL